jgi:hypothetical protein
MALRITIDVFSGRPNPVVRVEGPEEEELIERLGPGEKVSARAVTPPPESALGYRGLIVEVTDKAPRGLPKRFRVANGALIGPRLSARTADPHIEDFVFGSTGPIRRLPQSGKLSAFLLAELERTAERGKRKKTKPKWPKRVTCRCAPLFEPAWWNVPAIQPFNNCYNYATNYRSDTFAQPGLAAGAMYTSLTCASVLPASVADALIDKPGANNKCPPEGHLVALVIAPGFDFHWFRKGRNGYWSHKPGSTPVTNLDNSGDTIPDPRTADRGPYTQFCTFMVVMHGHIKIR